MDVGDEHKWRIQVSPPSSVISAGGTLCKPGFHVAAQVGLQSRLKHWIWVQHPKRSIEIPGEHSSRKFPLCDHNGPDSVSPVGMRVSASYLAASALVAWGSLLLQMVAQV
ncbi:fungal-specific transcription factor domain-containing protein [Penicillium brevicompactum]